MPRRSSRPQNQGDDAFTPELMAELNQIFHQYNAQAPENSGKSGSPAPDPPSATDTANMTADNAAQGLAARDRSEQARQLRKELIEAVFAQGTAIERCRFGL